VLNKSKNLQAGFTLLELIVVMGVMTLLFGLIGFSLSGSGTQIQGLQRELISMILKTRNLAISEGVETRLAIRTDSESKEHFFRFMEIHSEGNLTDTWVVQESDFFLPKTVWFVPDELTASENFKFPEEWFSDGASVWSGGIELGEIEGAVVNDRRISFRKESSEGRNQFSYIAFDGSGRLLASEQPKLIFSSGNIKPTGDSFTVELNNEKDIAGLIIQRFGGIIPISSNDLNLD